MAHGMIVSDSRMRDAQAVATFVRLDQNQRPIFEQIANDKKDQTEEVIGMSNL